MSRAQQQQQALNPSVLSVYSLSALKAHAKDEGVPGYSKLKKGELISKMLSFESGDHFYDLAVYIPSDLEDFANQTDSFAKGKSIHDLFDIKKDNTFYKKWSKTLKFTDTTTWKSLKEKFIADMKSAPPKKKVIIKKKN